MINSRQIKSLIKNPDIRRLLGNFFSLSILKVFNLILPFVTLPYLIKTLGLSQYGVISIALSLSLYFNAIAEYGFYFSATRAVALHRHSRRQLSFIYNSVMSVKILLLTLSIFTWLLLVYFVPQFYEHKVVYLFMLLYLIGRAFFPEWFFRGVEQMFYITILDLIIKGTFTVLVFILIHKPGDYWLYLVIYGTGFIVVSLIAHILILKTFKLSVYFIKCKSILKILKKSFPLFVKDFFPNLYNNTTGFLVGMLIGNYAAGLFNAVRQLTNLLSVFNSVITTIAYPYLSRNKEMFWIYRKYYLALYTLVSLFFILLFKPLLTFIGIDDLLAWKIGMWLVVGLYAEALNSVYSTNYLLIHKYDSIVMKITMITSFIGFIGAFLFILVYGALGGSINIALSQIIASALFLHFFKKINCLRK